MPEWTMETARRKLIGTGKLKDIPGIDAQPQKKTEKGSVDEITENPDKFFDFDGLGGRFGVN